MSGAGIDHLCGALYSDSEMQREVSLMVVFLSLSLPLRAVQRRRVLVPVWQVQVPGQVQVRHANGQEQGQCPAGKYEAAHPHPVVEQTTVVVEVGSRLRYIRAGGAAQARRAERIQHPGRMRQVSAHTR